MADVYQNFYNPDVLSCLANLSNDEAGGGKSDAGPAAAGAVPQPGHHIP